MNNKDILDEIFYTRKELLEKFEDYENLWKFVDQKLFDLEDRVGKLLTAKDLLAAAKSHNRCSYV